MKNFCAPLALIIYTSFCFLDAKSELEARFFVGPSWFSFFSFEQFTPSALGSEIGVCTLESIKIPPVLMPYFEARMRGYLGSHFNAQLNAGGAFATRAHADIQDVIQLSPSFYFTLDYNLNQSSYNIAIINAQCGFKFGIPHSIIELNPLIGFIYNQQDVHLHDSSFENKYWLKNKWHGPLFGLEVFLNYIESITCKLFYKFVLGKVHSQLKSLIVPASYLPPGLQFPSPDSPNSQRCGNAFGNIFGCEFAYRFCSDWQVGTVFNFLYYQNHKNSNVNLGPNNPYISSAQLRRILWEQFIWTFFVECDL